VVQYGYLGYFSSAFPAAALFAWAYNINLTRLEANQLITYSRRPRLYRVKGVRVWIEAVKFIAYTGIMVNILNLGLSSFSLRKILGQRLPPDAFSYFPHVHSETVAEERQAGSTGASALGQEWGSLDVLSSRGEDYRGKVDMLVSS
jgi:hypothetical protein